MMTIDFARHSFANMGSLHPYYPLGVNIPNYVPNNWSTLTLVSTFAATCTLILAAAKTIATKSNPQIPTSELTKVLWFTLCSCPYPSHKPNH